MAIRIALHELGKLIENGLSAEDFVKTRDYLMKNVYLMTATSDQQLGYALDSRWYGTGEFTQMMRDKLQKLTVDEVNQVIRKHLSAKDLSFVIITKDAEGLKQQLLSIDFSCQYDGAPAELLARQSVGALKLNLSADKLRITGSGCFCQVSGSSQVQVATSSLRHQLFPELLRPVRPLPITPSRRWGRK
jgi:zinc protease